MLKVKLSDMFVDSEGHELSYALAGDYGTQTKIAANEEDGGAMYLYFTSPDAGTVDVQLKASCKSDPTVSATHTIAVTVKKGESGDAAQYGYDESPAETVKVYVTVSPTVCRWSETTALCWRTLSMMSRISILKIRSLRISTATTPKTARADMWTTRSFCVQRCCTCI